MTPPDDRPSIDPSLLRTRLTSTLKAAGAGNWSIRLDPPTLRRAVTFTPRDFYQDGSAYMKLWSPATVDPGTEPPSALMPGQGRGAIEVLFRTAADTAYVVECVSRDTDRMQLHITEGDDAATLTKRVRNGRSSHAVGPHPEGTQVRMMLLSQDRWSWYELSIEPRPRG